MEEAKGVTITAYTCSSTPENPGPSGYAAVLVRHEGGQETKRWVVEGCDGPKSSNQRGKLVAAIEALRAVPSDFDGQITIISNADYLVRGARDWLGRWREKGLENRTNGDLWTIISRLIEGRDVVFKRLPSKRTGPLTKEAKLRSKLAVQS